MPHTEKYISIQEGGKSPNFTTASRVGCKFQERFRPFYKKKKSLNENQRASHLRKVSQENQVLLNRLQQCVSSYNVLDWERERRHQV